MVVADGAGIPERVVIIGAGLAGSGTATALRQRGYAGEIVLIGTESGPPYDRPPLSKAVLLADEPPDPLLPFDPVGAAVDYRPGVVATGWTPGTVRTDREDIDGDAVVVATGAVPMRLPGNGALYLRTRADAFALRERLRPGARVVIVGAGWIGAEVATAARARGAAVTVLEQAATPVAHALPANLGAITAGWYAAAGIDLRCGVTVESADNDGVTLVDGERIAADVVVVGVGVRAACDWLADSPVPLDRGVLVGPDLRAEGARHGVWAVGDVAARWSPRYERRVRGEHWDDALRAPTVVAANVLGDAATYDPVPYVWSEQFGRMVQYAGEPGAGTLAIPRGDPERDAAWSVVWLDPANIVIGVLAVDRPRDFTQARRLADAGTVVDPARLADADIAVKAAKVA